MNSAASILRRNGKRAEAPSFRRDLPVTIVSNAPCVHLPIHFEEQEIHSMPLTRRIGIVRNHQIQRVFA